MISERIKCLREQCGMTQAQLAKQLGLSRSGVNAWEMGISVPSVSYLVELAEVFQVTTDYLLERTHQEMVDISGLDEEEKQLVYQLLACLKKRQLIPNESE